MIVIRGYSSPPIRKIDVIKPYRLFDYISDQTKDKLMYTVSRETQREKILGLLEAKQPIFHEIEYNYKLNQSTIPVTHKTITVIRNLASTVSVLINILMVLFYDVVIKNHQAIFKAEVYETYTLQVW